MSALDGYERAACRSCGAPVVWVRTTPNNKNMPLDETPAEDGNCVVTAATMDGKPVVRTLKKGEEHYGDKFTSHFQTCPDAGVWKR